MILSDYREARNVFKNVIGEVCKGDMKDFILWLNKECNIETNNYIPYNIKELVEDFIKQDKFYHE